jgi:hypothetical protein
MTTMLSLVLAYNPQLIYSTGFQLSVAAVFGILLLTKPLKSLVERSLLRPLKRPPVQLSNLISVSLAAQLATSPIVAATFDQVSVVGVFTNLIAVPLSGLILILGLLGSRRKHLPLARLPSQRLQRFPGHDPDTDRSGGLLAPVRVGDDARCNPSPRRLVLRRMRPPDSRRTPLLR